MICQNCQHENRAGAKFCDECGARLQLVCVACGQTLRPEAKFCDACGTKIEPSTPQPEGSHQGRPLLRKEEKPISAAERRQLTVLFCDLVGSTALSERLDAEDFRQVILDYQEEVEKVIRHYGGHIGNYLGDGLLVYFGYPKGLEDAPRAGVRAGLAILEAMDHANKQWVAAGKATIAIRIGLHTGLVVVDEHLALGDTTNIAARLEGLAPENGLVISPQTRKLVQGWFEIQSIGPHLLKGISQPMEIFQVLGETGATSRIEVAKGRGLSPLVGREKEVASLRQRWKQAKGGYGQVVLLHGEAGIGKSRLVAKIKEQVKQETNTTMLELRCSDYHNTSPYYPIIDLLEKRIFRFKKEELESSKIEKLSSWLERTRIEPDPHFPIFSDFLSIPLPEHTRSQYDLSLLGPEGKKKKLMEGLIKAVFYLAQEQPLLFIVEDLHWADPSTLEWLDRLIERMPEHALLFVGTTRPGLNAAWFENPSVSILYLQRLSTTRIEAICRHQTQGKPLPREVLKQIKEKTDGIPLFVEELTRMIIESDLLTEKEDHFELASQYRSGLPPLAIPSTLQDSLIARLDRLSSAKEIAQTGAVLGREFSFELLQMVAQKEPKTLEGDLARLAGAELLYQRDSGSQSTYIFKHALIQDAAYGSLLKSKRQQLHQRVVDVLENHFQEMIRSHPELLAKHLSGAGLKDRAVVQWEEAGLFAIQHNAFAEAIQHFYKGLDLLAQLPETIEFTQRKINYLTHLASAILNYRAFTDPEIEQLCRQALALCEQIKDYDQYFTNLLTLSFYFNCRAAHQEAQEGLDRCLELAKEAGDNLKICFANGILGHLHFVLGNYEQAKSYYEEFLKSYSPAVNEYAQTLGYGKHIKAFHLPFFSTVFFLLGNPDKALSWLEKAQELAAEYKIPGGLYTGFLGATQYWYRREGALQVKFASYGFSLAAENGGGLLTIAGSFHKNFALAINGDESKLDVAYNSNLQVKEIGFFAFRLQWLSQLIHGYLKFDRLEEAGKCLQEAFDFMKRSEEGFCKPEIFRLQGELFLRQGQPKAAEASYGEAIDIARQQSTKWHELLATKSLARLWQSQGKTAEAYDLLNGVFSWFTEGFDTIDMQEADELLSELAQTRSI